MGITNFEKDLAVFCKLDKMLWIFYQITNSIHHWGTYLSHKWQRPKHYALFFHIFILYCNIDIKLLSEIHNLNWVWFCFQGELDVNQMGKIITDETLIIKSHKSIKSGPTLPRKSAAHCMVHIEDRYFMVLGGFDTPYKMASPSSFYINYVTGDYLDLPFMQLGRANHACLKYVTDEGELMVNILSPLSFILAYWCDAMKNYSSILARSSFGNL